MKTETPEQTYRRWINVLLDNIYLTQHQIVHFTKEERKMEAKYKVGDKVKLINHRGKCWNHAGEMDHYCGREVIITNIDDYNFSFKGSEPWRFSISDIACLVSETPSRKFKVGDRVKIIAANYFKERIGSIGRIVESSTSDCIKVQFSADEEDHIIFSEDKLELVKNSNLIEVDYIEHPNTSVQILAIRNLLAGRDIKEKYGEGVFQKYQSSNCWIVYGPVSKRVLIAREHFQIRHLPHTCSREYFDKLIIYMRSAGKNLVRAIHEVRAEEKQAKQVKPQIKTITI